MNPQVEVSVILPTYNRALLLPRAISSVVKQTFPYWELLIVDDGSTDDTSQVLREFSDHPRIKTFSTANCGVSAARNLAIAHAAGPWVSFLDSDDEWLPEKLQRQMELLSKRPELRVVHTDEIWIRNGVRVNPMTKHRKRGGWIFNDCLKLCCMSPSTMLLQKSLLEEVGLFREDFPVCEDFDLWLRITCRHEVGFVDQMLIKKYGGHEDQLSRRYRAMDLWRALAIHDRIASGALDSSQRDEAYLELNKKCEVLLRGYRKHGNFANYDVIHALWLESRSQNWTQTGTAATR